MADRRYRGTYEYEPKQDWYSGEMERLVYGSPDLRSKFDYAEMEERYPIKPIQIRQQQEQERLARQEDLNYRKTLLDEKLTELSEKKTLREMDLLESEINKENAILEQMPLARQALGQLDPRDPEYLKKRIEVIEKYPMPFEYTPFVERVDSPMVARHLRLREGRIETGKEVTEDAFQKAAGLLSDSTFQKQVQAGDPIAAGRAAVARETYNQFMRQRGIAGGMEPQAPMDIVEEDMSIPMPQGTVGQRPSLDDIFR